MARYGIAMLGCGFIARTHANVLKGLSDLGLLDLDLAVACDVDAARAQQFCSDYGFRVALTDFAEAVKHADVNVVFICTPTNVHMAMLKATVERGHALFCEKPLAHTAAEARHMADMVRSAGVLAQVGLVLRYSPVFVEMKAMLEGDEPLGDAGRPMAVIFRDDQCFPIGGIYGSQWRADLAQVGGGTIIEHSIHDLDLLRWMFGEVASVTAHNSYFAGKTGIEDVSSVLLTFANGATATLQSIWHDIGTRNSQRYVEIFCQRGWLRTTEDFIGPVDYQLPTGNITTLSADQIVERNLRRIGLPASTPGMVAHAYFQEALSFFRCLDEKRAPSPGLDDAVAAHVLVDAVYESARTGSTVKVATPAPA
jgi:predicted dehydrogenase